jgi:hypothetical protein
VVLKVRGEDEDNFPRFAKELRVFKYLIQNREEEEGKGWDGIVRCLRVWEDGEEGLVGGGVLLDWAGGGDCHDLFDHSLSVS